MAKDLCHNCGKPEATARAGSMTSYFFQHNFCQCQKEVSSKKSQATIVREEAICLKCGKSRPTGQKAGSFTAFLFKELRCQCARPKFRTRTESKSDNSRTLTAERIKQRRRSTEILKAQLENASIEAGTPLRPGTVIGGTFKIESMIGEGGMGVVYLAYHQAMQKKYALKILAPDFVSEEYWLRFQAEAKILAALNHPNLVNVYDLGVHEKTLFYYSMDYLKGRNLEDILAQDGAQSLEHTIEIFLPVLDALAYAHRQRIVHRDIKPANIFICASETAGVLPAIKILDFGISKLVSEGDDSQQLTAVGEVFGSPFYMSPEQCMGETVDARSDLYSVGCSIFETLTGYVPFEADSSVEIALMHEEKDPPNLSAVSDKEFPASIDLVIAKCLAKLPRDRYQSAKELALDLERIKQGKEVTAFSSLSGKQSARVHENGNSGEHTTNILSPATLLVFAAVLSLPLSAALIWVFTRDHAPQPELVPRIEQAEDTAKSPSLTLPAVVDDDGIGAKEFSKSAAPYLINTVRSNEKQLKVFSFSPSFSIGTLTYFKEGMPYTVDARGECIVPADAYLSLNTNPLVGEFPELLKKFYKDDLKGIIIGKGDSTRVMPFVSRMTELDYLSLPGISFEYADLPYLKPLTKLAALHIELTPAGQSYFAKTKMLTQLSRLSLRGPSNISEVLARLSSSTNLDCLDLDHIVLTEADVKNIASIEYLKSLSFKNMTLTKETLDKLSQLPRLKSLALHQGSRLDSSCLEALKKFKNLKTLLLPDGLFDAMQEQQLFRALPKLKRIRQADKAQF